MMVKSLVNEQMNIESYYDSSNILKSEYIASDNDMIITFKNGTRYKYFDVPLEVHFRLGMHESTGKYFNEIKKEFQFEKIEDSSDIQKEKNLLNEYIKEYNEKLLNEQSESDVQGELE